MSNSSALQDIKIDIKFKLSALWVSVMFLYIYGDYFALYPPGQVEKFIQTKTMLDNPMKLFAASILMTIPSIMIFLSLTLKPQLNRWLNIIMGAFFSAIMILIAVTSRGVWLTFYIYLAVVESMITITIVRLAWTWPKQTS